MLVFGLFLRLELKAPVEADIVFTVLATSTNCLKHVITLITEVSTMESRDFICYRQWQFCQGNTPKCQSKFVLLSVS